MKKRVCLGKVVSVHGLKGLVKLCPFGEDTSLLNGTLYTAQEGENSISVTLKSTSGKYILAEINGVSTREAAEDISGTELWIERDKLPEISENDAFYIEDLMGLSAVDKNGQPAGTVIAVHNFGAGDLLEIKPPSGEAYLLPFTKEHVPEINENTLVITPPEMLDA